MREYAVLIGVLSGVLVLALIITGVILFIAFNNQQKALEEGLNSSSTYYNIPVCSTGSYQFVVQAIKLLVSFYAQNLAHVIHS